MQHTIGDEFTWAREGMAELLCEDGIEVKGVTTDPDSSAGRAADSLFKDGLYKVKPVHYLVESFNRTLRRSLPRNVTFTRNFAGRAHSAAHSSNNGPGDSIRSLCAGVGCAIPSGGSVDKSLFLLGSILY